jgi:hypothetical protein
LRRRFYLSPFICGYNPALVYRREPDTRNKKLTYDNHYYGNYRSKPLAHKANQHRAHKSLVSQRIKKFSEVSHLIAAAGNFPVNHIGQRSGRENGKSQPLADWLVYYYQYYHQGHQGQPQ